MKFEIVGTTAYVRSVVREILLDVPDAAQEDLEVFGEDTVKAVMDVPEEYAERAGLIAAREAE